MKTYNEIELKQEDFREKHKTLDRDNIETKEERIIFAHWVDFLDDLLNWNGADYAKKIGFDYEQNEELFEITDEVKKEILITREQAEKQLKIRQEIYKKYPYGKCSTTYWIDGIYIEKLERDILKWILE